MGQNDAVWGSQVGIAETQVELGRERAAGRQIQALHYPGLPAGLRWRYKRVEGQIALRHGHSAQALDAYLTGLLEARDIRRSLDREEHSGPFVQSLEPMYREGFGAAIEANNLPLALACTEAYGAQMLSVRLGHQVEVPIGDFQAATVEVLGRSFGQHWTVLRYAWHGDKVGVFVLESGGLHYREMPVGHDLHIFKALANPDNAFRRFAYLGESLTQDNVDAIGSDGRRQLAEMLLPESVQSRLNPDHTLVVIPSHGLLHGLPFQALLIGDQPLIQRATILYAPSLGLLLASMEDIDPRPPLSRRGLVCGQSAFTDPKYQALPGAQVEAQTLIAKSGGNADCFVDDPGIRARLIEWGRSGRLRGYGWLHFVTHTAYDPPTGAFTGLVFSEDEVGLEEIASWPLGARLVTLSACQAGAGRWYAGDEIVSLTHTFLGSGAKTVVASLWLAPDRPTASLMGEFYDGLAAGLSPSRALAHAQRKAHSDGLAAYYWAAFSTFGCC
jgi:hypothetical protein